MHHDDIPQPADSLPNLLLMCGTVAMLTGVVIGAFGAHGLRAQIAPALLATFHTGVEYHFYHGLGLLAIGLLALHRPGSRALRLAGWCFVAGIALFSGSLYLLALTGIRGWGALAPIGGVAFILGWAVTAYAILRAR